MADDILGVFVARRHDRDVLAVLSSFSAGGVAASEVTANMRGALDGRRVRDALRRQVRVGHVLSAELRCNGRTIRTLYWITDAGRAALAVGGAGEGVQP